MLAVLYNNRILLKTFSFNLNTRVCKGIDELEQMEEHPLKICS